MIPSLFLSHGSPYIAIEDTPYTRFLDGLGSRYQPKAIVIFTAHWEAETLTISAMDRSYDTIYDFGGFPELRSLTYPAPGSSLVAGMVQARFEAAGVPTHLDTRRGLDHGVWTLLRRLYPAADIPVVQLSVHPFLAAAEQLRIGEALDGLGEEDILIIGSGATVHNLRQLRFGARETDSWAEAFDDWLIERMDSARRDELADYMALAPEAARAVPRPEHFVPLLLALGSGGPHAKGEVLHRSYDHGNLSYLAMAF
ncbi:dioxygenase [Paenibacillus sp. 1P07SE]|uniref:dioxygenase family protein n=1 Tax=Paenibacillus sp. 1P07SE TaxID=3132209 RepID=UPI0039A4E96C